MKIFYGFLLVTLLSACVSTAPYNPPAECTAEGSHSVILEKFPDPRVLDQGLLMVQMAALKKIDGYTYKHAMAFLDKLESMVDMADMTYADLAQEIIKKVNLANEDAGALIFIIGPQMNAMDDPTRIQLCDRVLIAQEFARQRVLVSFYAE